MRASTCDCAERMARRDDLRLDGDVVGHAARHEALGRAGVEEAHQVVGERQVEAALAGVALTAGTTAQLVVDAAGLVALGAEHVEPAGGDAPSRPPSSTSAFTACEHVVPRGLVLVGRVDGAEPALVHLLHGEELGVAAEHDVGAAAGHVRGDGDGAVPAGLGDDRRLAGVVLRVQHLVPHALLGEQPREVLALLDARRADEHRLALAVTLDDVLDDLRELRLLVLVDEVGLVDAHHRLVRGDRRRRRACRST